jgi:hypothetical protein
MTNTSHVNWISQRLRAFGPYLLIELLLPGGTLIALLLWLSQHGGFDTRHAVRRPARGGQSASVLRAMLRQTTLPLAKHVSHSPLQG